LASFDILDEATNFIGNRVLPLSRFTATEGAEGMRGLAADLETTVLGSTGRESRQSIGAK
jgi:hypothetical protein